MTRDVCKVIYFNWKNMNVLQLLFLYYYLYYYC